MAALDIDDEAAAETVNRLVDAYRVRCLWFLRPDYYPESAAERDRVLTWIAQHGDHEAFRRVAELRTWLFHHSNGLSAGS